MERGERVQLPLLLAVVLLRLAQASMRSVIKKKNKRGFSRQGKESDKSEKMEENQQPSKVFTILKKEDLFKWVLPDDTAQYANSHFNQYIPERDLTESIFTENTVPSDIAKVKKTGRIYAPFSERKERIIGIYLRHNKFPTKKFRRKY